jgi:hypothetical protein
LRPLSVHGFVLAIMIEVHVVLNLPMVKALVVNSPAKKRSSHHVVHGMPKLSLTIAHHLVLCTQTEPCRPCPWWN